MHAKLSLKNHRRNIILILVNREEAFYGSYRYDKVSSFWIRKSTMIIYFLIMRKSLSFNYRQDMEKTTSYEFILS